MRSWRSRARRLSRGLVCLAVACHGDKPGPNGGGETGAVPVSDCAEAPWDDAGVVAWVDAAAEAGGDGSASAPLSRVSDGLKRAAEAGGGVVAVLPGSYAESVDLDETHDGVKLVGRCAAAVELVADDGEPAVHVSARGAETSAEISGFTLTGGSPGLWLEAGPLSLSGVSVLDSTGAGVSVGRWGGTSNADLTVDQVEILGVSAADPITGYTDRGAGMLVLEGTTLRGADLKIEEVTSYGLWAFTSTVELEGLRVLGARGLGVAATLEAEVALTGPEIGEIAVDGVSGAQGIGLYVESGSSVMAAALVVHDTSQTGVAADGSYAATTLDISGLNFSNVSAQGMAIQNTSLNLHGDEFACVVDGVGPWTGGQEEPFGPVALNAKDSDITLTDCTFEVEGAQVWARESSVVVRGVTIDGAGGLPGYAACLQVRGTTLEAQDSHFTRCQNAAIMADSGALTLTDVDVEASGSVTDSDGAALVSPALQLKASALTASQVRIRDSRTTALLLDDGSVASVEGLSISGVSNSDLLATAIAVAVQGGSTLAAEEMTIEGAEGVGLFCSASSCTCTGCSLSDLQFAAVVGAELSEITLDGSSINGVVHDPNLGGGVGVAVGSNAPDSEPSLTLSDTDISEVEIASVYLDGPGTYQLLGGTYEGGTATRAPVWPTANAVFALNGVGAWDEDAQRGLLLDGVVIAGGDGGAVFLDGSSATLRDVVITATPLPLVQDRCDGVEAPEGAEALPDADLCPTYDYNVHPLTWYLYSEPTDVED